MDIGASLPIWSIIPFVGMLLSIAIFPLVKPEWWEKNELTVALFWSAIFLIPFIAVYGFGVAAESLSETILGDYVPFIVLLLGLFTVAGGIHVKGTIVGTTKNNVIMLALGTIIASWVGTTGAAMLLIRPVLRANLWRRHKAHIVVFFIFLVANIGGCLTPLGDPPLFLGYLRGIPFFWTFEHIWVILLFNTVIMLVAFALIDRHFIKKEGKEGLEALKLEDEADERTPIRIEGWHNFFFLALIILAVILNGTIPQMEMFIDPATGATYGIDVEGVHIGVDYVVQIVLILAAMAGSWFTTSHQLRADNKFEWAPIAEVAKLFIGIFITMIPALALLRTNGSSLGVDSPLAFFWSTGLLSSFLDNSPTYVVFLTTAGAIGSNAANAVATTVGSVDPRILLAISAGAVFMGANTYIGNAPNFMVKNIAEKAGVKMPSFFHYMGWSAAILIPLFILDSIVFFL
ncbi:sodium:proton antiporter [Denitrobacterium detoxificans]|uniref:Na+/H+ antiporter NhaD n=1 Tax=Denitrobacterium detoxificans TaxID=79604 RepID=A0A1H8S0V4_9ACTN|nr:sodium:proton antiporter [Denitrobacterium detoxificans]SEO71793.1 Na+/H+ antiporter NhaD [Denitrobacterium detoxificans]